MNFKINMNFDFLTIILIVNIVFKLLNIITWDWFIVLWPLWVTFGIVVIFFIVYYIKRRKNNEINKSKR